MEGTGTAGAAGTGDAPPTIAVVPHGPADFGRHGLAMAWAWLEQHGWFVLALVVAYLMARPYINDAWAKRRASKSLAEAAAPSRVSVLEEERRRIREQQAAMYEEQAEAWKAAQGPGIDRKGRPKKSYLSPEEQKRLYGKQVSGKGAPDGGGGGGGGGLPAAGAGGHLASWGLGGGTPYRPRRIQPRRGG